MAKAREGNDGGFAATVSRTEANEGNNVVVSITGSSRNPLALGAPAIDYALDITIIPGKDGAEPTFSVSGSHDGFPAYEINVQDAHGKAYQIYHSAPESKWQVRQLLPPMDVEVR